jgi:hypothetical protein
VQALNTKGTAFCAERLGAHGLHDLYITAVAKLAKTTAEIFNGFAAAGSACWAWGFTWPGCFGGASGSGVATMTSARKTGHAGR